MTRYLYMFISGMSMFIGAGMILCALVIPQGRGAAFRLTRGVLLMAGIVLVIFSSAPLPLWLYAVWAVTTLVYDTAVRKKWNIRPGLRLPRKTVPVIGCFAGAACILAIAIESPWHVRPKIDLAEARTIYVIGDSLSSGIGAEDSDTWCDILRREHGLNIINLAVGGATAESAMRQAGKLTEADALVILEIGGNDLLGSRGADEFETALTALIEATAGAGRKLVMFELPLPPLMPPRHGYGHAQRRLARKYGMTLIPKHVLAQVLAGKDSTLDGLHLSPQGHRQLAELVWAMAR